MRVDSTDFESYIRWDVLVSRLLEDRLDDFNDSVGSFLFVLLLHSKILFDDIAIFIWIHPLNQCSG